MSAKAETLTTPKNFMETTTFKAIKELGFSVVITCLILWNNWQMQSFIINSLDKKDQQLQVFITTLNEQTKTLIEIKNELAEMRKTSK